jgi:acyl dehydratase
MPFNRACTGKSYSPYHVRVSGEAIARFARALRDDNPNYTDESRRGGILAPPAFAAVLALPALRRAMGDQDLGVAATDLVPLSVDLRFTKLVRPGSEVIVTASFEAFDTSAEGDVATVRLEASRRRGLPIFEGRVRLLDPAPNPESAWPSAPHPVTVFLRPSLAFKSQSIVEAGPPFLPNPSQAGSRRQRAPSREFLRRTIAIGYAAKAVVDNCLKRDPSQLKRIGARLVRPLRPGEILTTAAWIVEERRGTPHLGFEVLDGEGAVVLADGVAAVVLK